MKYGYKVIRFKIYKNLDKPYYILFSLKCIKNNILSMSFPLQQAWGDFVFLNVCFLLLSGHFRVSIDAYADDTVIFKNTFKTSLDEFPPDPVYKVQESNFHQFITTLPSLKKC